MSCLCPDTPDVLADQGPGILRELAGLGWHDDATNEFAQPQTIYSDACAGIQRAL